jgi:hypothetical protein
MNKQEGITMKNNQAKQGEQNNTGAALRGKLASLWRWFAAHAQLELIYPMQ